MLYDHQTLSMQYHVIIATICEYQPCECKLHRVIFAVVQIVIKL